MRVFHADAVEAVDVILEPFKIGEGRVIAGARDFEEGPAGPDGLGRQSTVARNPASVRRGGKALSKSCQPPRGPQSTAHSDLLFALYSALPWRLLTNRLLSEG